MSRVWTVTAVPGDDYYAIASLYCGLMAELDVVFVTTSNDDEALYMLAAYIRVDSRLESVLYRPDRYIALCTRVTRRVDNAFDYFASVRTEALTMRVGTVMDVLPTDASLKRVFDPVDQRPALYVYDTDGPTEARLLSTCSYHGCLCRACVQTAVREIRDSDARWNGVRLRKQMDERFTVETEIAVVWPNANHRSVILPLGAERKTMWLVSDDTVVRGDANNVLSAARGDMLEFVSMPHRDSAAHASTFRGLGASVVCAGPDRLFVATSTDLYGTEPAPLAFIRDPACHDVVFGVAFALSALELTPYVVLWIVDWLPRMHFMRLLRKTRLIESVQSSIRRVVARRQTTNKR